MTSVVRLSSTVVVTGFLLAAVWTLGVVVVGGCTTRRPVIAVDGSSTLYPISEALAEEFRDFGLAHVTVGVSGTGGGFRKFCRGDVALIGASRPIRPSEASDCLAHDRDYIELPIAYDGIAVVVHRSNTWVDALTVDELRRIWSPRTGTDERVERWSDLRPGWPARTIRLYGPGLDSGTYDYFTKAIVGSEGASRADYTSSEDDNMLVRGVAHDPDALAFFGLAYYAENRDKLRLIAIDDNDDSNGVGPVAPSLETIRSGSYQPLTRPIFIYADKVQSRRPEVRAFVNYYLERGPRIASEIGYVPLPFDAYVSVRHDFWSGLGGSRFGGQGSTIGVSVEQLLAHSERGRPDKAMAPATW